MKTTIKNKQTVIEPGKPETLPTDKIDFSPLNYRKYFRQDDLETFAEELKVHGIISPLTVRKRPKGRYELVAGERRLRAAKIAKLPAVPVIVRELTDEQVTEIQLAENLQRENPHPMDEAQAIKLMQDTGKNMEEISLRLGKSKKFVYIRLKLLNLIESIREMFYANVISIQQALDIATITQDSQAKFFNDHCRKWKQKSFELGNLEWYLKHYKYDLKEAPFDIKDKKLIPEVGACSVCPFNSATVKSLFPELSKQAVCSNVDCYFNKCKVSLRNELIKGLELYQPSSLLFYGDPSELTQDILKEIPHAAELPRFDCYQVTVVEEPEKPEKEDYTFEDDNDKTKFDKKEYNAAMQEYKEELENYNENMSSGKFQKGLLEKDGKFYPAYFNTERSSRNQQAINGKIVTMKVVQEAIKTWNATPELLDEAIGGIKQREQRAKELDREKIQNNVHKVFLEKACDLSTISGLTEADFIAARLLVYQSLDYSSRQTVHKTLFKDLNENKKSGEGLYETLKQLSVQEYSYLIRMALAGKSDSKFPGNETGITLYRTAEGAGIDVIQIEKEQQEKAEVRLERMKERIKDLQKRKVKLKNKVSNDA